MVLGSTDASYARDGAKGSRRRQEDACLPTTATASRLTRARVSGASILTRMDEATSWLAARTSVGSRATLLASVATSEGGEEVSLDMRALMPMRFHSCRAKRVRHIDDRGEVEDYNRRSRVNLDAYADKSTAKRECGHMAGLTLARMSTSSSSRTRSARSS